MIAFAFTFPTGRYHATAWGRHVNEADVAWPPEPVRILRALIATWWRKADHERFPKAALDELIDTLAQEPPVFRLPERVVHTHIRAFMPAPTDKRLIFDAFLRFDPSEELVVAWPNATLSSEQEALAQHLLDRIGYLGRAESWASARLANDWDGVFNACRRGDQRPPPANCVPVDIAVPREPNEWAKLRGERRENLAQLKSSERAKIEATLPERLCDALAVDTSDWRNAGWSSPLVMQNLVYDRPEFGPLAPVRVKRKAQGERSELPEVARYLLAGRPQPRIEDTLIVGEIARRALMSQFKGRTVPDVFSGKDGEGALRDDPGHRHAFFIPEATARGGAIDSLIIYSAKGFDAAERVALDRLTKLWAPRTGDEDEGGQGREEWRLALENIAPPDAFNASRLLGRACNWVSVTPYLMPWFAKRNLRDDDERTTEVVDQIRRELERRGLGAGLLKVEVLKTREDGKRAVQFRRFRSRRGLAQPDRLGQFLKLRFDREFSGPLSIGFACHYGLGLFEPADD